MNDSKTISEMGEEYLRQAAEIEERMHQLKAKLPSLGGAELLRARKNIVEMWNIVSELRCTGEYLKNYYEEGK